MKCHDVYNLLLNSLEKKIYIGKKTNMAVLTTGESRWKV